MITKRIVIDKRPFGGDLYEGDVELWNESTDADPEKTQYNHGEDVPSLGLAEETYQIAMKEEFYVFIMHGTLYDADACSWGFEPMFDRWGELFDDTDESWRTYKSTLERR